MNTLCLIFLGGVIALVLDRLFQRFVEWLVRRNDDAWLHGPPPTPSPWQYDPAVGQYLPPEECDYDSLRNERHV